MPGALKGVNMVLYLNFLLEHFKYFGAQLTIFSLINALGALQFTGAKNDSLATNIGHYKKFWCLNSTVVAFGHIFSTKKCGAFTRISMVFLFSVCIVKQLKKLFCCCKAFHHCFSHMEQLDVNNKTDPII